MQLFSPKTVILQRTELQILLEAFGKEPLDWEDSR